MKPFVILKPRPKWLKAFAGERNWVTLYPIIYYPDHVKNPDDYPGVIAHESMHLEQQRSMGVWSWVRKYGMDRAFRLDQEAQAIAREIAATPHETPESIARRYAKELSTGYSFMGQSAAKNEKEAYAAIKKHCAEIGIQLEG